MAILLVVEDDEAIREALEAVLARAGHEVQGVASGQAALDTLHTSEAHLPDLIVTDLVMPGMSGPQLLEAVRAHPAWEDIPFLFISAGAMQEMDKQIAGLSKVSLLPKPFDIETLCEAVDAALEAHSGKIGQ